MSATFNWYILYTNFNGEVKLAYLLSRKGYETYCPQYAEPQKRHVDEQQFRKSLFSSWVFVRCEEEELYAIKNIARSAKVVYRLDRPAVVKEEEISTIRYVLSNFMEVRPVKTGIVSTRSKLDDTAGKCFFALPSIGYALTTWEGIQKKEAYRSLFEEGADMPSMGFLKRGRNTLTLLKKSLFCSMVRC